MCDDEGDSPTRGQDSTEPAGTSDESVPQAVVDEVERLTRLARRATDTGEATAYRRERERLLSEHEYTSRIRDDGRATLVLYPAEWKEDGAVHLENVDDVDRGIEVPLEGPGSSEEWETVDEHNRDLASLVEREHGPIHGANARALADFASNHYAKPIDDLTDSERQEFLTEYFPRNAFPSDDQKAVVEESVRITYDVAGDPVPTDADR